MLHGCSTGNAPISITRDRNSPSSATDPGALAGLLASGFAELAVPLDERTLERLLELARMVSHWNEAMNLTGHRGEEAVVRRLVLDAVALFSAVRKVAPKLETVVDLGSGAGFPGLPIAIVEPRCRVLLVDSRERRHHFQRAARRQLALENLEPMRGRAEVLTPTPADLVIAQAVTSPSEVQAWGVAWAKPGGVLVIPGADPPPEPGPHTDVSECGSARYRVPLSGPRRSFWWGRRRPSPRA